MSRHPLRHDKTCLNCGAIVQERFCTRCGQENVEPTETVGSLVNHFFEDLTHFDGKFFVTVKDLLLRPGFLTREYVAGRRMRYLNPIRMYVFISALFFLALFAGSPGHDNKQEDSAPAMNKAKDDTLSLKYGSAGIVTIDIVENKFGSVREYDSVQRALPDSARDNGIMTWVARNNIREKVKHGGNGHLHLEVDVRHDIPKIMFFLLPLFALYVGWFYSRKKYYYVNHAIFSVHFHSFAFLLFLFLMLLDLLIPGELTGMILAFIAVIFVFGYLVAALRGMYRQSFWLSLAKGIAISALYFITLALASTLLLVTAVFRI